MSELPEIVLELKDKVNDLLGHCEQLKEEKRALEIRMGGISNRIEEQDELIEDLNEKIKVLKTANSLNQQAESTSDVKLKINELVKEIDKCVALLNK